MTRVFVFLAMVCSILLAASVAVGLVWLSPAASTGDAFERVETWITVATAIGVVGLHLFVNRYLRNASDRCTAIIREGARSDRYLAEATKNRLRPFGFATTGMAIVLVAMAAGPANPVNFSQQPYVYLMVSSGSLAFNVGAFFVEYLSVVAQARLSGELLER